jgi:purine-nucleoside/S-methyl-5'-thioadenosine phosphorylase / adenosine deaminase
MAGKYSMEQEGTVPANSHRGSLNRAGSRTLVLRVPAFSAFPWLVHGFSTRIGGVSAIADMPGSRAQLNLGNVPWDTPANVDENRRRLLETLQTRAMRLVIQQQIHSDLIRVIEQAPGNGKSPRGDGLITGQAGLLLAILAADCLPVLLVDERQRVVAAMHCGWRGTARRLSQKGVGRMRLLFGSRPDDLRAAIGPGIRACCYRVGEEVAAEFESQFLYSSGILIFQKPQTYFLDKKYALMRSERWRGTPSCDGRLINLDLVEANVRQLEDAGVSRGHIYADAPCTSCNPQLFFSHRRDAGHTGRMMGLIGIRQ